MYSINSYVIRHATSNDVPALERILKLDGKPSFCGPALIGEIGGTAVAAVSLDNGRVIADPLRSTADLRQLLQRLCPSAGGAG